MTPKEKANELFGKFYSITGPFTEAKECALIVVDEIIDAVDWHKYEVPNDQLKFWFEVKQEIEKL